MSDLENTLYLDLETGKSEGRVVIELFTDKAPNHCARLKELAREKFYDGVVFHRVIDGFMAQGGDPTGTGMSGSGTKMAQEFNDMHHDRGVCSMARAQSPDSADSQFFICLAPAGFLDGQYTAWGRVTSGMELVDDLPKGEPPRYPGKIKSIQVAADAE